MKTIAVDFDGVIHRYSRGWQGGDIYDEPVDGAFDALRKLTQHGYNIVIYTTRENHDDIQTWLMNHGAYGIDLTITSTKPPAIAYIDDRAIRFTNWPDMLKYFA